MKYVGKGRGSLNRETILVRESCVIRLLLLKEIRKKFTDEKTRFGYSSQTPACLCMMLFCQDRNDHIEVECRIFSKFNQSTDELSAATGASWAIIQIDG